MPAWRTTNVKLSNYGIHSGTADVYAWGLFDKDHTPGISSVRAVGVQSQLGSFCDSSIPDTDRCLVFAINGWHQWSNAAGAEFDIGIDTNGDGTPDYFVVGVDLGTESQGRSTASKPRSRSMPPATSSTRCTRTRR